MPLWTATPHPERSTTDLSITKRDSSSFFLPIVEVALVVVVALSPEAVAVGRAVAGS
jgi:hypothetical protein